MNNGKRQLWIITDNKIKGIVVTRVFKIGVCQIELCAGHDLDDWIHHLPEIEDWARQRGCDMEVVGRPGWLRKLKKRGYGLEAVILRKKT